MKADAVLALLKQRGKPQTAAIYKRHGSGENVCGVLTSELTKLKRQLKVDHALAMELWDTGNAEACILALMIADPGKLSRADADAERMLATIEREIHRSPNWARHAMNGAVISIGIYKPKLRKQAVDAAKRIGKVEVDHGETSCKTPAAVASIEKASKRKRCP